MWQKRYLNRFLVLMCEQIAKWKKNWMPHANGKNSNGYHGNESTKEVLKHEFLVEKWSKSSRK